MEEVRTMVVVTDNGGDISAKLMLTDDQIRFLNWLQENDHLDRWSNFQVLDDEVAPEII